MTPKTTSICLIGPRASGKTTYLATLANFPHHTQLKTQYPHLKINYPINSSTQKLSHQAEDILKKGAKLAGTRRGDINYQPTYHFRITISEKHPKLEIIFRDIAGEIFEQILQDTPLNQPYIDQIFKALSWMIMITDWQTKQDRILYKPVFEKLYQQINEREQTNPTIKKLRIAVVMSKCERGEIWAGRLEPDEDLFKVRLPETYDYLTQTFPTHKLKFFACSSFGVLSTSRNNFDPRPNRYIPDDGSESEYSAFLREPEQWQPFGLIAPIYWLTTGKTLHDIQL